MILRPMVPLVALAGVGVAVFALCLRAATQQPRAPHQLGRWGLRAGVFALLLVALMRPSFSGAAVPRTLESADIFLVVDRSGSMSAEDFDGQRPRIEGVRGHLVKLARRSTGSRFSLVGFGSKPHIMLPLTDNTEALINALEALNVEPTTGSRGSSITAAKPVLEKLLKRSKARHGSERQRLVVYVGDGEDNSGEPSQAFFDLRTLIDGGLVLGYGTSEGARMREMSTIYEPSEANFIAGPGGVPAVSRINERNLRRIAAELSATYHHMRAGTDVGRLSAQLQRSMSSSTQGVGTSRSYRETYWLPMAAVALLVALELGLLRRAVVAQRRRSGASI
jgi:Ca-activated chloride channel family protein